VINVKLLLEREKVIDDSTIYGKIYKLYKSYLLMLSDHEEMGIGNVLLSNPPTIEGIKASVASYALFGLGNDMIGKIMVEKAASYLKTSVLLLLFIKTRKFDDSFIKFLIEFLNDILKEIAPTNK
jgi:hypothetical protein